MAVDGEQRRRAPAQLGTRGSDMTLGRREFVVGSVGAATLSGVISGCAEGASGGDPEGGAQDAGADAGDEERPIAELALDTERFADGVASGDPLGDRVILWSRLSGAGTGSHAVRWVLARDPELTDVVREDSATTSAARDFTIKVDVDGLSPGSVYYYGFAFGDGRSAIGRTRTLPDAAVTQVRFAFTSCANFNNGYFHAYRQIAQRSDLDVWVHLGDYIYEYADGEYGDASLGRTLAPLNEIVSLEDYRTRYALYRRDPDLQELHRQHPLIVVWDDHEFADNAYADGAYNHQPDSEGDWGERKRVASQAFLEWLPIRVAGSALPPTIYRSFAFGNLFDLIMLDTRIVGRAQQAGNLDDPGDPAIWTDPGRQLLGSEQEAWLTTALSDSQQRGATWRVVGNQVMFAETKHPLRGNILNADQWDGYQPARQRIVSHVKTEGIENLVVLTGDIHTSWAFELAENPFEAANYDPATGRGSYGIELVCPAVTSLGLEGDANAELAPSLLPMSNPHLKFINVTRKGYVLVDVTDERLQAEWYFVANHKEDSAAAREETLAKAFVCMSRQPHLVVADAATPPREDAAAPAPSA
jgi:alkaline phosphatase D